MNGDERAVFDFLSASSLGKVEFEPNGNVTPDFLVNSRIAVEVRRLNRYVFRQGKLEGLENFEYALRNTLNSIDHEYAGKTYLIGVAFHRWSKVGYGKVLNDLRSKLEWFLAGNVKPPCWIAVGDSEKFLVEEGSRTPMELFIFEGTPTPKILFKFARMDEDVSGSVILDYALAIGHSIREKTEKVRPHLHEFEEWWLFLVDHLGTFDALDAEEIRQVECSISDLGGFARVGLVDVRGRRLLLDIQSS